MKRMDHSVSGLFFWRKIPVCYRHVGVALLLCGALVTTSGFVVEAVGLGSTYVVVMTLISLALVIGPTYEQSRVIEAAKVESMTDSLTGIGNRRAVVSRLHEEMSRCSRGSEPLAILMIDVDRLKEINDKDSHHAGDDALRSVANVLRNSTRVSDTVGRLGGDEFLVIAPATTKDTASALAERIAQEMSQTRIRTLGSREIGLSIGVAVLPASSHPSVESLQGLLDMADQEMYAQKCRHYAHTGGARRNLTPLSLRTMTLA